MLCDLGGDHFALALAHHCHVDRPGLERPTEFGGVAHEMGDPRARNLILAWHTSDVGTGAANPLAFHDGSPPSGCCHLPGHELAASSAAKHEGVVPFGFGHGFLHSMLLNPKPAFEAEHDEAAVRQPPKMLGR